MENISLLKLLYRKNAVILCTMGLMERIASLCFVWSFCCAAWALLVTRKKNPEGLFTGGCLLTFISLTDLFYWSTICYKPCLLNFSVSTFDLCRSFVKLLMQYAVRTMWDTLFLNLFATTNFRYVHMSVNIFFFYWGWPPIWTCNCLIKPSYHDFGLRFGFWMHVSLRLSDKPTCFPEF